LFGEPYLLDEKKYGGADFTIQFSSSACFVPLVMQAFVGEPCLHDKKFSGEDFKVRLFCASRDENLFHRSYANLVRKNKP